MSHQCLVAVVQSHVHWWNSVDIREVVQELDQMATHA